MRKVGAVTAALYAALWSSCADTAKDPLAPAPELAVAPLRHNAAAVTNDADAGAGSFRAALELANANRSIRVIRVQDGIGTIGIESTLTYTGKQSLRIEGAGATVDASAVPPGGHALMATGGGDLTSHDITFENADGNGVLVEVPSRQKGNLTVALRNVTLRENGLSGLYVDDQSEGSNAGGGDSDAGIVIDITESHVVSNGFRPDVFDFDGVRVDEGGKGHLFAVIVGSTFTGNAGDGIELDETGDGNAHALVHDSRFDDNGTQPQNADDLEDGFDIDENDAGSIVARLIDVTANGNQDEGIDLDEEGTGNIGAWFTRVVAVSNLDSNITLTEDEINLQGGNILFVFHDVQADDSEDDDGFKAEEFGAGNLNGLIALSSFSGNDDDGLQIEQNDAGSGILRLLRVTTANNGDDAINPSGVRVTGG